MEKDEDKDDVMLPGERSHLTILMDKYIPSCLEVMRSRFKTIVPLPEICHLQMLCRLLDSLLLDNIMSFECPREIYELIFVFACVWAFGSALSSDSATNQRTEFSTWWLSEFKAVRFNISVTAPTVFDFFIDFETMQLLPWTEKVPK